ncbi:MAG TPA: hypothetical protein VEG32_09645 [Clostridia bacterium]|nr:hypothetical protein [Clostridia bacterium]
MVAMLRQVDERTVRGDGWTVIITDDRTIRYEQGGRRLHFEINVQCCGGIQFVLHTYPAATSWEHRTGEDRVAIAEAEYKQIVHRVREALEYLQLQFAVD